MEVDKNLDKSLIQSFDEYILFIGATICLYQLVKNYEYKKKEDRAPLNDAMNLLMPIIQNIMVTHISDLSAYMTEVRKTILKIFHALIQYILPMDLIKKEVFTNWMYILQQVCSTSTLIIFSSSAAVRYYIGKCNLISRNLIFRLFNKRSLKKPIVKILTKKTNQL